MAKSFPIKIARRCDKSGAAPATPCFAGGSRAGENGTRQRAGCRFRVVAPSTHRRAGTGGVAGIQRKPPAFSTPPARPANLKACSVTSAGYAVALATSMDTIFGSKAGGVFFLVFRISAGWWGIRISSTRRCWRDGDYRLRRITDRPGLRRVVENRREISGEPDVLSADRHSRAEKIPYR